MRITVAVASNSIKSTVSRVLENINIKNLFDLVVSNEDVLNAKPHRNVLEMYVSIKNFTKRHFYY